METLLNKKYDNFIGADESGTGSFFGGLVSTAVYIPNKNYLKILKLGITDSKKMYDSKIIEVYDKVLHLVESESYIMTPLKYNELNKNYNLNELKTIAHMETISKLDDKVVGKNSGIILDDYCGKSNFEKYVRTCGYNKQYKDLRYPITFEQKGELKSLSVACASVIARYLFLESIKKIENKYKLPKLPQGANNNVIEFGKKLVKFYGKDILYKTGKMNFKTADKILEK